MQIKQATAALRTALQAEQAERLENIKTAQHNARCPVPEMRPYKNAAYLALVRQISDLIAMVDHPASS